MVILLTGQSGLEIDRVIGNFITQTNEMLSSFSNVPQIQYYKVESKMIKKYAEENGHSLNYIKELWNYFLGETYPVMEAMWDAAIVEISHEIKNNLDKNTVHIVCFHAVYYHYHRAKEYVSFINIEKIKELQPDIMITLIDDIYDIHNRLIQPDKVFFAQTSKNSVDYILELLTILEWRQYEVTLAKYIARLLTNQNKKVNHYLYAVKHSNKVFQRLINKNVKTAYLSHHITSVRNSEKKKTFFTEMDALVNELQKSLAIFLPTTIDEFRIKRDSKGVYIKELTQRWESDKYSMASRDTFFDIQEYSEPYIIWDEKVNESEENIDSLINVLGVKISDQVTARDYTLVDQSDILIFYRPFYLGGFSLGMDREFEHYLNLKGERKKIFTYSPKSDVKSYLKITFEREVEKAFKDNLFLGDISKLTMNDEEQEQLYNIRYSVQVTAFLSNYLVSRNYKVNAKSISGNLPLNNSSGEEVKKDFSESFRRSNRLFRYKNDSTLFFEKDCSAINFSEFSNLINADLSK